MKKATVAILLLLVGVLAYKWFSWPERYRLAVDIQAAEGASSQKPEVRTDSQVLKLEPQAYQMIARQTLFRSDRKGFEKQQDEDLGQDSKPALPKIRLLGIILTEKEPPAAMILDEKSKKNRFLHIGDELDSWTIQEITPGYVVLSWKDQLEKIQLRKF